ncbi:MAG TPA: tetratricopeptide repeat protein [Thermoanaerobaculia bacterium]
MNIERWAATWPCSRKLGLWLLFLLQAWNLPAAPQPEPAGDAGSLERAVLVQRLVLDRAAAIAAVQRVADFREEQLFAELAEKDRQLRAEIGEGAAAQAELAAVTAERQRLVDDLAARHRQFAAEIGEYRRQVASIASSPDPRKRAALERYAEGDREGAFLALVEIQKAETKAVAAGWREIAALAADRMDRGEMSTAEVISFYEEAQRLDPDDTWGWIELRRLYMAAGRLPEARDAAEKALARAAGDRDRSAATNELGDVLVSSGDLSGARSRFEESLGILERLASANPSSAAAQRDLSVSLERLGDVLVSSGDLSGARSRFEESLGIRERLASANPSSAEAQRDLIVSHVKLAGLPGGSAHWGEALKIALELEKEGRLAPRDAWIVDDLRRRAAAATEDGH